MYSTHYRQNEQNNLIQVLILWAIWASLIIKAMWLSNFPSNQCGLSSSSTDEAMRCLFLSWKMKDKSLRPRKSPAEVTNATQSNSCHKYDYGNSADLRLPSKPDAKLWSTRGISKRATRYSNFQITFCPHWFRLSYSKTQGQSL